MVTLGVYRMLSRVTLDMLGMPAGRCCGEGVSSDRRLALHRPALPTLFRAGDAV